MPNASSSSSGSLDEPHALAAAAGRRLEQDRKADLLGRRPRRRRRSSRPRCPGTVGTSAARIACFAEILSPIVAITSAGRADEDEVVVDAGLDERRVLGEEAVAGMHRLAAGRRRGGDHARDAQIAVGGRRRADVHGLIGEPHVQRVLVGGRVDGDRLDAELVERADHPDGDLAPVRDEDPREHH